MLGDLLARGMRPELVISQPDRPAGRGRHARRPPVVDMAEREGLDCVQTPSINLPEVLERLTRSGAGTLVVAAFGQLLKSEVLERFLCLNVHPSLLPLYRGAAPIRRALMDGCNETGVCIMRMSPGLDEGPITHCRRLSIDLRDDHLTLGRALAFLGALGVEEVLTGAKHGNLEWREQVGEAVYASKLTTADRRLRLDGSAHSAHDQVRALAPDIGAETQAGGIRLKIWRTWPLGVQGIAIPAEAEKVAGYPGRVSLTKQRLFVGCGEGALELLELQAAGKRRMGPDEFLRGYLSRVEAGLQTGANGEGA
ncbi:MAG TPA: methionyl-tRNA formyltransferase [Thermoleophilia bacterium]|nr:methionyl-tRNA formyltransferase [Thermoleophilia bacterium]